MLGVVVSPQSTAGAEITGAEITGKFYGRPLIHDFSLPGACHKSIIMSIAPRGPLNLRNLGNEQLY